MEPSRMRPRVDGKFFRLGEAKFYLKGVAYGPFAPNAQQEFFPNPAQAGRDFGLLRELGANLLRVYYLPPRWFLDLALEQGFRVLTDIPWNKNRCFLDSAKLRRGAREAVREAIQATLGHPAILAYCLVNEIPAEIVRWSHASAISDFIDELAQEAKMVDSECLCTFANYPPTEFLHPQNIDFFCYNVYLHEQRSYENYLARLQMQAGPKPLVIGEFGIDSLREGEARKCEILSWQIESSFRAGLAGTVVFSFSDEWYKDERLVPDWNFGLTTAERQPKASFQAVQAKFKAAPKFPLAQYPKVSVVVASYNGARTLRPCLDSLVHLQYPEYEIILVDDGSSDATPNLATLYPAVRYVRLEQNMGLSVARNVGIQNATGETIAFTDADCRADQDWLYYLVGDLLKGDLVGIGGPNFLPPEDSAVAAAVMASPGGPAHVMLNDREAEHIPGCNMAFYRWALLEIGGFDPIFRKAGDDVDICWRLQEAGFRIGFSPSGFVWHYRRSTPAAYLKQQSGYGEAEALLAQKHPEYFNPLGGSMWRGRIYGPSSTGLIVQRPVIYHGLFGAGFFQRLYGSEATWGLMFLTSLEYQVLVTLPLFVLSVPFHFLLPIALSSLLLSLLVCFAAAWQAVLPRNKTRFWSRPLIAGLFFLQPIWRGFARYRGRLGRGLTPAAAKLRLESLSSAPPDPADSVYYWTKENIDRLDFLARTLARLDEEGWTRKVDTGWCDYDVEILGNRWSRVQITSVTEYMEGHQRLFRCRIHGFWSLTGKLVFAVVCGIELLIIGLLADTQPWLWMLLLSLPILAWFLEQEKVNLQRLMAAFLDEVAAELNLAKVCFDVEEDKFIPVGKRSYAEPPPKRSPEKPETGS